jgi:hypothetical protein
VGHTSRSSSLLRRKVSLAMVSQTGFKTGGGATMGHARGIIMEVTCSLFGRSRFFFVLSFGLVPQSVLVRNLLSLIYSCRFACAWIRSFLTSLVLDALLPEFTRPSISPGRARVQNKQTPRFIGLSAERIVRFS